MSILISDVYLVLKALVSIHLKDKTKFSLGLNLEKVLVDKKVLRIKDFFLAITATIEYFYNS